MLAMIENGVTSYSIIIVGLILAGAAGQCYMSIAWYWVSWQEKATNKEGQQQLKVMYKTKATIHALMISVLIVPLIGALVYCAPWDLTYNAPYTLFGPSLLAFIAIFGTMWLENEEIDTKEKTEKYAKNRYYGYITEAKLYLSLLMIAYASSLSASVLLEYLETTRPNTAGDDWGKMASTSFDPTLTYTGGWNPSPPLT
jgi:hypothetical protein